MAFASESVHVDSKRAEKPRPYDRSAVGAGLPRPFLRHTRHDHPLQAEPADWKFLQYSEQVAARFSRFPVRSGLQLVRYQLRGLASVPWSSRTSIRPSPAPGLPRSGCGATPPGIERLARRIRLFRLCGGPHGQEVVCREPEL